MTEETFAKYKKFFEGTLVFSDNERKIQELTRSLPGLFQKAISILSDQLLETKNTKTNKDQLYGEAFKKLKERNDRNFTTKEIDYMIRREPAYKTIAMDLNKQETYLGYFEKTVDNIKSIQWQVKNYIELKKFFSGDY